LAATEATPQQVFTRVALATGLVGDSFQKKRSLSPLVSALCGIRTDRLDQAHLVLAARNPDYQPATLERALLERKTLLRTWGVRGHLQIVPRSEVSLYLAAAGITAPRWKRFLEARSNLSTTARLRLLKRLCPDVISREAMRDAIADANTRQFILREAAQEGYIVWSGGEGPQATFAWTKDWLGEKVERQHDYQALVGAYISSYGPVDAPDLAGWLGVTVAAARKLVAKHRVAEVKVDGESVSSFMKVEDLDALRMKKSRTRGIVVVPPGDPLLHAYKSRFHPDEEAENDQGLAFVDGRVAAWWTLSKDGASVRFLDAGEKKAILQGIEALLVRAGVQEETTAVPA